MRYIPQFVDKEYAIWLDLSQTYIAGIRQQTTTDLEDSDERCTLSGGLEDEAGKYRYVQGLRYSRGSVTRGDLTSEVRFRAARRVPLG